MRPAVRRVLWITGGLLGLLLLIAVALPFLVDVNRYRPLIEGRARAALGRDVRLGAMRLSVLPHPGLSIEDIAVAALPQEGGGDLLTARALGVGASLLPLLRGRLEVTSLVLDGPSFTLTRDAEGSWGWPRLPAESPSAPADSGSGRAFVVRQLRIRDGRLTLKDRSVGGSKPLETTLDGIDLVLSPLAPGETADIRLSATLAGTATRIEARGRAGPIPGAGTSPVSLGGEIEVSGIEATGLAHWLNAFTGPGLAPPAGILGGNPFSLSTKLQIQLPARGGSGAAGTEVSIGHVRLEGVELSLHRDRRGIWNFDTLIGGGAGPAPAGVGPPAPLLSGLGLVDAKVRIRDEMSGVPRELDLDDLDLELSQLPTRSPATLNLSVRLPGGSKLQAQGRIDASGSPTSVDLTLAPTLISAETLSALLGVAQYELPISFSSTQPIEMQAHVRGQLGGSRVPQVEGRLRLREFTFQHPSMSAPLTNVGATVTVGSERIEITDFSGRLGESDAAGKLTVEGFEKPRVGFAIQSRRADLGELLSFVSAPEKGVDTKAPRQQDAGFARDLSAEGSLRVAQGSYETLDFTSAETTLRLDGRKATLDPFTMSLYGGRFRGAATAEMEEYPARFTIRCDVEGIDVDALLVDNLNLRDALAGRLEGSLQATGRGVGYEGIVRSLSGGGRVVLRDGRVGRLGVLRALTRVSGVFGEQTLQTLSRKLETEGTPFATLSGTLRADGPRLRSEDLQLESPDLTLQGRATFDLLASTLDGRFDVIFSEALSRSMRAEKSRAASVFWNPKLERVSLPLTLAGPYSAPTPGVEWGAALDTLLTRKAGESLRDRLHGLLGGGAGEQPEPSPGVPPPPAAAGDLEARVSRVRWSGPLLAKDLKLEGDLSGPDIVQASLTIIDSSGREVTRVDKMPEVDRYFAGGAPRSARAVIPWSSEVDGKKLVLARFPLAVTVTVLDSSGHKAETRREVKR